ncbi:hypothetical protein PCANC_18423 [Puccinia coronata f. sp. avenae]|nr:hypothetical protein PCANC_18423 [Puccinia coronata f. sp. avenae]PLW36672.1 hypothetical protein PCASD_14129 [Puccinia coronata f. sp. avenae]
MNSSTVCMVLLSILSLSSCAVLPRQVEAAKPADTETNSIKGGKGSGTGTSKAAMVLDAVTKGLTENGLTGVGKITASVASGLRGTSA